MLDTILVKPLKYGILNDTDMLSRFKMPLVATEVFANQSGKFVARSTASASLAVTATTELLGYANTHAHTVGTGEVAEIYNDIRMHVVIPSTDTDFLTSMRGKTCDIKCAGVTSVQYADLDASSTDILVIYDGDATLDIVEVGLNPLKMFTTGVV